MKAAYWQKPGDWPISIHGSQGVVRFQTPWYGSVVLSAILQYAHASRWICEELRHLHHASLLTRVPTFAGSSAFGIVEVDMDFHIYPGAALGATGRMKGIFGGTSSLTVRRIRGGSGKWSADHDS